MDKVQVRFGEWIESGFKLYKDNFGLLVLVSLVAVALSFITVGILAGPMFSGFVLITMMLLDKKEPKPEFATLWQGFNYFLQSLLFVLVWGIIIFVISCLLNLVPCLGSLVSLAFNWAISALLMFGLFLIVDKKMDFWPASMESINLVKTNFWPFLGLEIVASIIGCIGAILCGIGIVLTLPIYVCILTVAYREVFGGAGTASADADPGPAEISQPAE